MDIEMEFRALRKGVVIHRETYTFPTVSMGRAIVEKHQAAVEDFERAHPEISVLAGDLEFKWRRPGEPD